MPRPTTLDLRLLAARGFYGAKLLVRRVGQSDPVVREHAAGKSFIDVGALWNIHGRIAFLAEEAGARATTALDITEATPEFLAERDRRSSAVRFVHGDLHDPMTIAEAGVHDVVYCAGVLYHVPHPVLTLESLRKLTGETLILTSATVPEFAGSPNGAVFFPSLPEPARRAWERAYDATSGKGPRTGLSTPFNTGDAYDNWWWGLTPSAIAAMLGRSGFAVVDLRTSGFFTRVVAKAA